MFDIGWDEMALIAVVSLIVIGPKDLPVVLRQMGRWTRKAREMAGEFQRGVDDMVRESELADLKKQVANATDPNLLRQEVEKAIDPTGELAKSVELPPLDLDSPPKAAEPPPAELPPDTAPPKPPEP
ncbi:MAG: Sec-independent protein translocase protein TatB [Actinomycetota bacterium]